MKQIISISILVLLISPAYSQDVTIETNHVKCTEQLIGLEFTQTERDSMLEGLKPYLC